MFTTGPAFFGRHAPAFTPAVWDSTGTGGNGQTISGGGHIATFGSTTGSGIRPTCRTTSTRNDHVRQVNFRFTGTDVNGYSVVGLQTAAASINNSQLYDPVAVGWVRVTGQAYSNVTPVGSPGAVGLMALNTWFSIVRDFTTNGSNLFLYDNAGTLIDTIAFSPGAVDTPLYIGAGNATAGPNDIVVEIDPSPTTLYGGAVKWDS